ncbi:DUF2336 domain-containing protein [Methylocystis sp. MJC1]|jgi:uncharacterized protein (DUF2336 family)|uniref:DUF2336 domain-containing protein n=1 Tax=Methylocystis sp. MJC1 TaxID=2654282 RepID=UPI0013EB9795|nr:DUF2336 domain-containing protein [Methylocystis sp. MJC1]KAF2992637.1 hypothetical protein MJC1_00215 [Methylocystis sp. MJC1]MBU6526604.1 DUF2336 domain-containing protein [Methylocystis sp. MJC1]UZX13048.1 DUF2336 domain-containing protein [Methylocystis sp. MJC1]
MQSDKSRRRIADASLLRAVVDQFVQRPAHPISDIKQFERLAIGLMDLLDVDEVARVVRPLCFYSETPRTIFARLLEKGGACAELALAFSPSLPREHLLATARQGERSLARALAQRTDLDREIVEALAQRGEAETLRALAANWSAHLDAAARRALMQAARDDITLARILLDRDDRALEPEALFLAATRLERTGIILNACRRALSGGHMEMRHAEPAFVSRLEGAALRRDRDAMAALLADALECRKERARAVISDVQGEALALALAALGVDPDVATRVFLCADPAISHDVERVRALLALVRSTPQRAAMQIVAAMTGAARGERDAARRLASRDEAPAGSTWRRGLQRVEPARKFDQSA